MNTWPTTLMLFQPARLVSPVRANLSAIFVNAQSSLCGIHQLPVLSDAVMATITRANAAIRKTLPLPRDAA